MESNINLEFIRDKPPLITVKQNFIEIKNTKKVQKKLVRKNAILKISAQQSQQ